MTKKLINNSFVLPCGAVIKNRLVKSAMSENMASKNFWPNEKFGMLYERWSTGGAGLVITGNVMIDSRYLGEAQNVVIGSNFSGMIELKKWVDAGTKNGTHLWMQINHPGKQSPNFLCKEPLAPSAIPFQSSLARFFNPPRELKEKEIFEIIERFTYTAKVAKEAGFTGVQIHGAHGYLISQFLSPIHNIRTDQWGGSLLNRMRFVMLIYKSMRQVLGAEFPISIKLNSSDFQKGGFTEDESLIVVQELSLAGIDLIEISGGTYESPEMMGTQKRAQKETTQKREAYFLEFCNKVRSLVKTPILLTGGFRTLNGMEQALESNSCDFIGLARSLALDPNLPNKLFTGLNCESKVHPLTTGIKRLDLIIPLEIIWYTRQIHRMGNGKMPSPNASVFGAIVSNIFTIGWQSLGRVRASGIILI